MRTQLIFCLLLILAVGPANAQTTGGRVPQGVHAREWLPGAVTRSDGRMLRYRLLLPAPPADPQQLYPVIVLLHGRGAAGTDNVARGIYAFGVLSSSSVRERFPAFVLTPQLPPGMDWDDPAADPLSGVLRIIERVSRDHAVDPARLYLLGEDRGAEAARRLLARALRRFAAGVLMAGVSGSSEADALSEIPLWIFHGAEDEMMPVDEPRRLVSRIWEEGGTGVRYTEFPHTGHSAWVPAWKEDRLLPWLFSQRRE